MLTDTVRRFRVLKAVESDGLPLLRSGDTFEECFSMPGIFCLVSEGREFQLSEDTLAHMESLIEWLDPIYVYDSYWFKAGIESHRSMLLSLHDSILSALSSLQVERRNVPRYIPLQYPNDGIDYIAESIDALLEFKRKLDNR